MKRSDLMLCFYIFQHFPKLKKAYIRVIFVNHIGRHEMLSPILPHVRGLTTLRLEFTTQDWRKLHRSVSCKVLKDITNLSLLERFELSLHIQITAVDTFFKKLTKDPKLQDVKLGKNSIINKHYLNQFVID